MTARFLSLVLLLAAARAGLGDSDPWTAQETIRVEEVMALLPANDATLLMVGPRILYNGAHIQGALYAGPAGKPEGLETLTKAAAAVAKNRQIVIYCGCCPMEKCPNIRPAYQKLKELGYTRVRVLIIPTNLHEDWTGKGFPVEKGDVPR